MEYTDVQGTNKTLASSFLWMFFGLLSTGIIAGVTYATGAVLEVVDAWGVIVIAQLAIAIIFGLFFNKLSTGAATALFFIYSMITGATFSVIFAVFELSSIAYALLATAGFFGVLAYLGYKTDKDLSSFKTVLYAALIIGLILTLVNIIVGNPMLDIILDWAILIIFAGLTVYDTNKIKALSMSGYDQEKVAIYGAMELYLDFINMFIRLLSIFGKRRN